MFRDFKEYQEIAKLYTEKVSKTENLEENRNQMAMKLRQEREANKPKTREEVGLKNNVVKKPSPFERKFGAERNQQRLKQSGLAKPSTAEIRAANPKVVPGTRTNEIGAKGGGKPSSGDLSMFKDKKPEISKFTKQGKERTPAQMAAAKRIGSGTAKNPDTTIAQVKQANQDSMRARAKERFAAFKAKRAEKKAAMVAKEELTPYDYVLEYLLSSEQAATIEEANYVMTEMDAETIQGIVEAQKKTLIEKPDDGYIGPKFLGIKTIGQRRKEFQLDSNLKRLSKTGDSPEARDMLNIPREYKITDAEKKKYGFK